MVWTAQKKAGRFKQDVGYLTLILPNGGFSDDEFFEFCQINDNLRIERNAKGQIIIMSLTGGNTGIQNVELAAEFVIWNRKNKLGRVFDSSTGFKLPNGATYSPDVAWVQNSRWQALSENEHEKHVPLCPDFVVELVSSSQNADTLKSKMEEYMENGCELGWLIDPYHKATHVFRPKLQPEEVPFDQMLYGGQILIGFSIKISDII